MAQPSVVRAPDKRLVSALEHRTGMGPQKNITKAATVARPFHVKSPREHFFRVHPLVRTGRRRRRSARTSSVPLAQRVGQVFISMPGPSGCCRCVPSRIHRRFSFQSDRNDGYKSDARPRFSTMSDRPASQGSAGYSELKPESGHKNRRVLPRCCSHWKGPRATLESTQFFLLVQESNCRQTRRNYIHSML